jgi:pimeloyl-ACP methyl ester carboxylesterase
MFNAAAARKGNACGAVGKAFAAAQRHGVAEMYRPLINPVRVETPASVKRARRRQMIADKLLRAVKMLFSDPFTLRSRAAMVEEGPFLERLLRGILYRLAFVPILAMLVAAAMVFVKTHPQQVTLLPDPMSHGVYFDTVNLVSDDHVALEGWLAPALDAAQVIKDKDQALKTRSPAVVLAHGFGMSRDQVLAFFKPLHDRGYVVLAVGLRGSGSSAPAGQTFGINEALDIKAAVDLLRRKSFVDGSRIAVVGIGSGANAAVLAADKDPGLAALALDAPCETGDEAFATHVEMNVGALKLLNPLCKLAFQLGYGIEPRDLDLSRYGSVMASRPTLLMRWSADAEAELPPSRVSQIVDFVTDSLDRSEAQADPEP